MSGVIAYSQVVEAVVDRQAWDESYFSLLSLKAHLQSLPGWQRFDVWAQDTPEGQIKVIAVTNWAHPEQLATWLKQGVTVDSLLRAMQPPPTAVQTDLYEEIA